MKILYVTNGHFDSALPLVAHLGKIAECTLNVQIENNQLRESICDLPVTQDAVGVDVRDSDTAAIAREIGRLVGEDVRLMFTKYPSLSFRDPRNWLVSWHWCRWVRRRRFDVVNYNGTSMLFFQQILLDQASQQVFTIHDHVNHLGEEAPQVRWLYRYMAARRRNRFIAQSDYVGAGFASRYNVIPERLRTVRFGALDLYKQWDDTSIAEEPATVLFFGRISPYKGLEYLANAWTKVRSRVPGARLIVAGSGSMYCDMTALNADATVEIHNRYIGNEELVRFIRRSSVVVLPYVEATQSGVVMTAYAFSKPVVATSVGALPEVVDDGRTGCLVPPKDPEQLANALARLLLDKRLRQKMGGMIEQKVRTDFSWERIARQTLDVYQLSAGRSLAAGLG